MSRRVPVMPRLPAVHCRRWTYMKIFHDEGALPATPLLTSRQGGTRLRPTQTLRLGSTWTLHLLRATLRKDR